MTSAGPDRIAELRLSTADDLLAAEQLGHDCALALGLDRLDALRVATAVSELAREIVATGGGHLGIEAEGQRLSIRLRGEDPTQRWSGALAAAAGVVDAVTRPPGVPLGSVAVTVEQVPARTDPSTRTDGAPLASLRTRVQDLQAQHPASPAEELRRQNRELLAALEQVRTQRAELELVNRELEETNKGVLALYSALSEELDRTNQGVVALYAEIEDKNLQLREASEGKSRFLRSISHELRTPVNSVLGLTGLLLDPRQVHRLSDEHTEQVEFIRASARDLLRLVEELLDLAKAESGRLQAAPRDVDLPELVEEIASMIEPLVREGVELVTQVRGVSTVVTDPDLLRHVLRNLLSNAAKFTTAGSVVLSAQPDGDELRIAVRDTGVGIAADDLAKVFEEFYQAPSPLHVTTKGTGLGLPFAQSVAQALGGRIEVESVLGEGSCFTLHLPMTDPAGAGTPASAPADVRHDAGAEASDG